MLCSMVHQVQTREVFHGLSYPETPALVGWVAPFTAFERRCLSSPFYVKVAVSSQSEDLSALPPCDPVSKEPGFALLADPEHESRLS